MKKIRLAAAAVLIVLSAAACTTAQFSGFQMTKELADFEVVGYFDEEVWVNEFLGLSGGANILNLSSDAMDGPVYDLIQREIIKKGGDAAIDITITQQAGIMQILINSLTGTLYAPCSVRVSATIVKYSR